jgi:short-subunit dehydrogenase
LTKRRCWSKRPAAAPSCPALTCVAARGCSAAVTSGVSELGCLDIVCANAGIMPVGRSIWQISARQCQDVIDINLTGVFNTLAVTASAAALRFGLHLGDYAAAKAGVIAWRKRWLMRLLRNGFA